MKAPRNTQIASADNEVYHIFIHDFTQLASVGILPHEREKLQRIKISIDFAVSDKIKRIKNINDILCYGTASQLIRNFLDNKHFELIETLAQELSDEFFTSFTHILSLRIRIEKPDIIPETPYVGIEIERIRPHESS